MIFPAGTTKVLPAPAAGPPRAPLAFRVGVVGHRPNRLRQADLNQLTTTLRQLLEIVKTAVDELQRDEPNLFENRTATLRAISPLAEGVDRLFATQALAAGYELCCVFPFAQSEYEKDFALE